MVTKAESHRLQIGSVEWRHPQWSEVFYPDGLPADWRVGYYGNEFPVVLVPASAWADATAIDLSEWSENSPKDFHFIVEVPTDVSQSLPYSGNSFQAFLEGLTVLQGQIAALLIPCPAEEVETVLQHSRCDYPRILDTGHDTVNCSLYAQICFDAGVGFCWHGQGECIDFAAGLPALIRVSCRDYGLKALRRLLEVILGRTASSAAVYLIFEGEPPQVEVMQNAKTLVELL